MDKALDERAEDHRSVGLFARLVHRRAPTSASETALDGANRTRRRIVAWALMIGLLMGLFDVPLPIEDSFRAARSAVRLHSSDRSIVVVSIDDRTLNDLNASDTRRDQDAEFLDDLFQMGAKRVFFDRAYADSTVPEQDQAFIDALQRHRPNVSLGLMPYFPQSDGSTISILPNPIFRPHANIVSIVGAEGPFGLSTTFPTHSLVNGRVYPSLSGALANAEPITNSYRVDFAIDYKTIPLVSYIDVLRGRVDPAMFSGRDVIVAPSSRATVDYHPVPYRDKILGAIHHAIGAETLKKGTPRDFSWYPAFLIAAMVLLLQRGRQLPSRRLLGGSAAFLVLVPIAFDAVNINFDVVPALIALSIAWIRLHRYAAQSYRGSTGLQRIEMLHAIGKATEMDVVALKIRNFATISASLTAEEVEKLLVKAQTMLKATDSEAQFAFEKDTFVWLRSAAPTVELESHVRGLHALFRTSITIGAHAPDVASSIGIDINRDASVRTRVENAMQCAEDAAHTNRIFMIGAAELAADRTWRLQILSELENAIKTGEVDVVFQPKVSLSTGAIVGAEALMRWNHPERGPIDPSLVIAAAEEHNRVDMITRFVLKRAMEQARRALAIDPSFKVAVNVSAIDLSDPMFLTDLEAIIAAYRFPVRNLVLEITETAPIENDKTVARTFAALKRLGVGMSVDDFGIGHASLHYLRQIPAEEVKIDRSFVVGMQTSLEDRALVRTAIDMIHSLGRTAVAEGVEDLAAVELLRQMGCDTAQGYYFYRPITMETLVPRMQEGAKAA